MAPSVPEAHDVGNAYCTRGAREQRNKVRCIVNKVKWMPNGRYLLTGTSTGELTLWDGHSFQFETLYRIHGSAEDPKAVRAMEWSNNKKYFITGGVDGCVNYRTVQLVTLTNLQAHEQPVRDLSFSPDDAKFCSCSDDSTVRVFDFLDARQEKEMTAHNWDVKCVAWHPTSSLIASGSKDSTVRLWDPRGKDLTTLTSHNKPVQGLEWNANGHWLLTTSEDKSIRLWDLRMQKEISVFNCSNYREATCIAWHPFHERIFSSGHYDGGVSFWSVGHDTPTERLPVAHDRTVLTLDWHPAGHVMASGSADEFTKSWIRQRPGDSRDQYEYHGSGRGNTDRGTVDTDDQGRLLPRSRLLGSARAGGMGVPVPGAAAAPRDTASAARGYSQPPPQYGGAGGGGRDRVGMYDRGGSRMGGGGRPQYHAAGGGGASAGPAPRHGYR